MARVNIWWDSSISYYRMTTPYNDKFRQIFKDSVPSALRTWDDKQTCWLVDEKAIDPVKQLVERIWHDTKFVSRSETEARERSALVTSPKDSLDVVIVKFVRLCPPAALQSCYRAAALALHPDRQGGDSAKMSQLNMLWTRLKEDLLKTA